MIKNKKNTEVSDKYLLYTHTKKIKESDRDEEKKEIDIFLKDKFQKSLQSENILILTGAGTSIGFGGKSMHELWNSIEKNVSDFANILKSVKYSEIEKEKKNLENLLSILQIKKLNMENTSGQANQTSQYIELITSKILEECNFQYPSTGTPHEYFIKKLLKARKNSDKRVKIFTLNYDTLFEEAADRTDAVLIDGFSFSQKRIFNSNNFNLDIVHREKSRIHNEESFYNKVIHLYKIHGSINWDDVDSHILKNEHPKKPVLIYPNSSKYEKSYEMPFFEMMSRFQSCLRGENSTLLIIGYSFNDDHINRVLKEAIKNNINLEVFVIKPNINRTTQDSLINTFYNAIDQGVTDLHLISSTFNDFVIKIPEVIFENDISNREKII
ncbi:MAG: SIR2 family protein [Candidatus Nomurabacteria bacterium]|nr:SIR2 family protein [Candidatus Nomurabacteria bacterium]